MGRWPGSLCGFRDSAARAARLLDAEDESGHGESGHHGDEEGSTPGSEGLHHRTGREKRQGQADGQPEHEDPDRAGPFVGRKQIPDQGCRSRRIAGLPDADAQANQQKRRVVPCKAARSCQKTPENEPVPHDRLARADIGPAAERHSGNRIDDGERRSDQAELGIAQSPFVPDRLGHDHRKDAIEEIEEIRQEEQRQHTPGVRGHPVLHRGLASSATSACGSGRSRLGLNSVRSHPQGMNMHLA